MDTTLSYLRKQSEPSKDFGVTASLIKTMEVDLFTVLEEVEIGYIGFYSLLRPDPSIKAVP